MPNATLEMACLFTDHEAPVGPYGQLGDRRRAIPSIDPCLVLLADGSGEVLPLTTWVPASVATWPANWRCAWPHGCSARTRMSAGSSFPRNWVCDLPLPFACPWMPKRPCSAVLSGCRAGASEKLDSWRTTLRVCGKLAWTAIRAKRVAAEAQMRAKSLLAQQATLEASHVEAANGAILEREERIRQKLASDARMNAVLKTAADGIIVTDDSGVIETFNAAAQAIFGYHAVESRGKASGDSACPCSTRRRVRMPNCATILATEQTTPKISAVKSKVSARTERLARWNWRSVRPAWRIGSSSP